MPIKTPHFGLEAFVAGDQFSASADQRRMRSIDSHMAFISDIIGPGVIDGWVLSEDSPLVLSVSSGWGMIDRNVTRTFGEYTKTVLDNASVYVWMRRRLNVIGQGSGFSDLVSFTYVDATAPAVPSSLQTITRTSTSIRISWSGGTESDFDLFRIFRSVDNMSYDLITETPLSDYTDSGLMIDTQYYYRISAIDKTGNESDRSSALTTSTTTDSSVPGDPTSVQITAAKSAFHLVWRIASFGNVVSYKAIVTPITVEGIVSGPSFSKTVPASRRDLTVPDLTNGQKYRVVLKAVGPTGVESDGVIKTVTPDNFAGPLDVVEIDLSDIEGDGTISDNILIVAWTPNSDPYADQPVSYEIQLKEFDGNGGSIISEWIAAPEGYSKEFKVFPYTSSGSIVYKSIESRKDYFVTIRAIDANGLRSIGKTAAYRTRSFQAPTAPTQLAVEQLSNLSLLFRWINTSPFVVRNLLTVLKTPSSNPSSSVSIANEEDIGLASSYNLSSLFIGSDFQYSFTLVAVDEFGNRSDEVSVAFVSPNLDSLPRPQVPPQQYAQSSDRQVTLVWSPPPGVEVGGYRVYRAEEAISYLSSDFVRVETLPADVVSYTDYGLDNAKVYIYFVTTLDIFGRESPNPVDDEFFDYNLIVVTPTDNGYLPYPADLAVVQSGSDLSLSWTPTGGMFDGYEVFRSIGNKHSFVKIDTVSPAGSSYLDEGVLTQSDVYYYIVRKFRNEADLFVTQSRAIVSGAILLGKVTTADGVMTFDLANRRIVKDLFDPIREEADIRIRAHKHLYYSDVDDRRINLGDTLTVSDWTTADYQRYSTPTDVSQTTTYVVMLNGKKAELYGLFFALDRTAGELTFETRLAKGDLLADSDAVFPFDSPPTLEVIFDNLSEVQGELPQQRLEGMSAQQAQVGLLEERQLPDINHEGRIKETLLPQTVGTISLDGGYRYAPDTKNISIGDAVVFYDILFSETSEGGVLVASTSDGVYTSPDFGLTWTKRFEPITPILRLFYSSNFDHYFGLTNRGILGSGGGSAGGFSVWTEIPGMENCKVARDIIEDMSGNVFCSADLGVFRLLKDPGRGSFVWQQTPIFGPRSTESYAMLFDSYRNRLIASNELGIFESNNDGDRWNFSNEMPETRPFFSLLLSGSSIFGLTNRSLWRRNADDALFVKIADLGTTTARKVLVWKGRLYIATEKGLLVSSPRSLISSDDAIDFETAFSQMTEGSYALPPASLNVIDGKLFVGTEERVYIAESHGRLSLQSDIPATIVPTIYVNGIAQSIGYRFSTSTDSLKQFICFDQKLPNNAVVTFANQYSAFVCEHGGWADCDFGAKVFVYVDGERLNDGSIAEKPAVALAGVKWPTYHDRNAHKAGADISLSKAKQALTDLLALSAQDPKVLIAFDKPHVNAFLYSTERFLSQLYPETRVVPKLDSDGLPIFVDANGNVVPSTTDGAIASYIPFVLPQFQVVLLSYDDGFKDKGVVEFGKYNELFTGANGLGSFGTEVDGNGSTGGTPGASRIAPPAVAPLQKSDFAPSGSAVYEIVDYRRNDPIEGFGYSRYFSGFGGVVGQHIDDDYGKYFVVVEANSLDGTVLLKSGLKKRNKMQIDITNPSFSDTGLPHWAIEDTLEWVNSGAPSHLAEVFHSNICMMGIALERTSPLLQDRNAPPYQGRFITPCLYEWYDRFNSTVDYNLEVDFGNKGLMLPYPNCAIYVSDIGQVLVGGQGGLLAIDVTDFKIASVDIDARRPLFIKDLYRVDNLIYILDESSLYIWNLATGGVSKDRGLNLPNKLYKIVVMSTTNLVIAGEDGIYARRSAQDDWEKVVSTDQPVTLLIAPDSAFAVSGSDVWYSSEGLFWNNIGRLDGLVANQLVKHRSQILIGTRSGAYGDQGLLYSGNVSVSLLDILDSLTDSSQIVVNAVASNFNQAIFGLSDGRYIVYNDGFEVKEDSLLPAIHRVIYVNGDPWLFGYDMFKVGSGSLLRRLATGAPLV